MHAEAFAELAQTLLEGFAQLGLPARIGVNELAEGAINLILAWHLLPEALETRLPGQVILYNLEQLDDRNAHLRERLARLSGTCEIWDYSRRNIEILRAAGFTAPVQLVPIGMVPGLVRIPKPEVQDIDVLFYGSVNPRRAVVLQTLEAAGLAVRAVFGVYGPERDALIARAKVVLNLHYYETSIFELVRVSYLWANRKAVVAECHAATELDPGLAGAARFVPYAGLVEACRELVADAGAREALERRGYEVMAARPEAEILRQVLSGAAEQAGN